MQEEEYDIHCRAEGFANSVVPDPDYYIVSNSLPVYSDACCKPSHSRHPVKEWESTQPQAVPDMENPLCAHKAVEESELPPPRKRRRHLSLISEGYHMTAPYNLYFPDINMNCVTLANGKPLKEAYRPVSE